MRRAIVSKSAAATATAIARGSLGLAAELDGVAARLAEAWPGMNRGWDVAVTSLHEDTVGDVRASLLLAFGAVLFTLLIACSNVANLLLTRLPGRLRDVSIRRAFGAT